MNDGIGFLSWIVIGIVAGWLAGVITKSDRGIWGDLALGLLGALFAGFIAGQFVGGDAGFWTSLIAATIGAVVLVILKNWILGRQGG